MSRRSKIIAGVLALVTLGSTVACAHHHRHPSPERVKKFPSRKVDHVLDRVDATDPQRAEVHRVKEELFKEYMTVYSGSKKTKQAFLAEWKSEKPNAEKLHALADERVAAYQKAIHETIDGMIEVHGTLNAEQRGKITAHIEKRMHD